MIAVGYDIGSSSIKCAFVDCENGRTIAHGTAPAEEMPILSPKPGWAEQDPGTWWEYVVQLTRGLLRESSIDPARIGAIGISYQMHGLVLVDAGRKVLRPSIIWCDSRAVDIGRSAFAALGEEFCLRHLLNSPGNFTASKLRWVKENEPGIYARVDKAMLPGEFIALRLTGEIATTISGLSEGIYWDFEKNAVSQELLRHYGIDEGLLAAPRPTFSVRGTVTKSAAEQLGLREGTPVAYCAGDQPNNAFSLNVLNPGEAAATAGTSGVVYGVTDKIRHDPRSRVNPFAHVNHDPGAPRLGILLCINGTGILNSWLRRNVGAGMSYDDMNAAAAGVDIGSGGVTVIPFGNGAERILEDRNSGCEIAGLDFNRHTRAHVLRAAQEGIAFSFKYGVEIMNEMGMDIRCFRAGRANMFLSPIFRQTLADITGATIELYDTDGAVGAARGGAIGAGLFASFREAFGSLKRIEEITPRPASAAAVRDAYAAWRRKLSKSASQP